MGTLEDAKHAMGEDWAMEYERRYGQESAFKALDSLFLEFLRNGSGKVDEERFAMPIIRAIASMTEDDIQIWMRKMVNAELDASNVSQDNLLKVYEEYQTFARGKKVECQAILKEQQGLRN